MPKAKKNKRLRKKDIEKLEATSAVVSGDTSLAACQQQQQDEQQEQQQPDHDNQNPVQVTLAKMKSTEFVE